MRSIPLLFFFGLSCFFSLFGAILFPFFPIHSFAPFLAIVYYVVPFSKALWIGLGYGILLDLLSSEFHFGIYALTLTLTSALLFHQKKHFFEDKPLAFSIFCSVISSTATIIHLILIHIFDRGIPFSISSLFTDVIVLPCFDGLYGFLWFTCPMKVYIYLKKRGWKNLFRKLPNE